jgi:hypothetical protein
MLVVSVLASSVVDHGFELRSGQTKDYKISICWVYGHSSSRICGGAVLWCYWKSRDRKSRDRKWCQSRDLKWRQSHELSRRMFCACATVGSAISVLVGPFDRKCFGHNRCCITSGSACAHPREPRRCQVTFGHIRSHVPTVLLLRKKRGKNRASAENTSGQDRAWLLEITLVICPFYFHIMHHYSS